MNKKINHKFPTVVLINILTLLLLASLAGCDFPGSNSGDDESLNQTQVALGIQQTMMAQQSEQDLNATVAAQQATISAQSQSGAGEGGAPTPDMAATQVALSVQATTAAAQNVAPPPIDTVAAPPPPPPPTTGPVESPPPAVDLDTMMKSAKILLYEDMVNDPSEYRYAKRTLDAMGLKNYKDDGSAKGWLKTDMIGGAPGGVPWDLVILAIETRTGVQGEFFEYLNDVLNKGSAVILEAWHLDSISSGTISTILTRCGVKVYEYFPKTGTLNDVVVWPLAGISHPILNDPNTGLSFTKARDKWLYTGDLGDLMALTGRGDAQILMGTNATQTNRDGTLAVCMDGQLIIMTHSSHSFLYETMYPLWENMIYNALKTHFLGSS